MFKLLIQQETRIPWLWIIINYSENISWLHLWGARHRRHCAKISTYMMGWEIWSTPESTLGNILDFPKESDSSFNFSVVWNWQTKVLGGKTHRQEELCGRGWGKHAKKKEKKNKDSEARSHITWLRKLKRDVCLKYKNNAKYGKRTYVIASWALQAVLRIFSHYPKIIDKH